MPLAAILGVCLLLPWPQASIVLPATADWQSAPSKENQPSNSPAQSSSAQQATEQQKASDQSTAPSQPPAAAPGCQENSQSGSNAKPDCKPATPAKTKKHPATHKSPSARADADRNNTRQNSRKKRRHRRAYSGSVSRREPETGFGAGGAHQSITRQQRCESEENLGPSTQREPAGHGKADQELHGASQKAANDGDVQRAYNLAVKANLLSAELAGH